MAIPPYMQPFVLTTDPVPRRREGTIDLHTTWHEGEPARPAVVFVHGGPLPADLECTPRDWPTFLGYGALAAASGLVGVTVDHRLHAVTDYPVASDSLDHTEESRAAVSRAMTWVTAKMTEETEK
ncbi:hypothetical protein [Parafrankia sp. EUN1f]|uniref:hypothetical protein n=1 Tax=Parafrankia sp. EUN1f TaxID=102897 RepID=UPI0001C47571|nr:hypothetical protein [Parafrankia sp. EUN1f]EFC79291.1 hypothetical protein FrEUN1fDRAFT_7590 [Parafrankia sp. EUN1f]